MGGSSEKPCTQTYLRVDLDPAFPFNAFGFQQQDGEISYLHCHNYIELGYCHRGTGIFQVENKLYRFQPGDAIFITRNAYHLATSTQGTVSFWSFIHLDPPRLVPSGESEKAAYKVDQYGGPDFDNLLRGDQYPGICNQIKLLADEGYYREQDWQEVIRSAITTLFSLLQRLPNRRTDVQTPQSSEIERIAPAVEIITSQLSSEYDIGQLATACHMSETNFRRVFSQIMGSSPKQYALNYRIQVAANTLTHTDKPIGEVAIDCGFNSLSSFNRHFKTIIGVSPREHCKATRA